MQALPLPRDCGLRGTPERCPRTWAGGGGRGLRPRSPVSSGQRCLVPGGPLGHRVHRHPEPQQAGEGGPHPQGLGAPRTGHLGKQLVVHLGRFRKFHQAPRPLTPCPLGAPCLCAYPGPKGPRDLSRPAPLTQDPARVEQGPHPARPALGLSGVPMSPAPLTWAHLPPRPLAAPADRTRAEGYPRLARQDGHGLRWGGVLATRLGSDAVGHVLEPSSGRQQDWTASGRTPSPAFLPRAVSGSFHASPTLQAASGLRLPGHLLLRGAPPCPCRRQPRWPRPPP